MARLFAILLFPLICRASWVKIETQHFAVFSSGGARAGRAVASRLEQVRSVFGQRTGQQNPTPLPVRVMLLGRGADVGLSGIQASAAGFYQSGTDQDYIVMVAGAPDLDRVATHEYVHVLLRHRGGTGIPPWLNEGLSEAWSTVEVSDSQVRAGDPVPGHLPKLRQGAAWMPLTKLFSSGKGEVSYPLSWALVHMLAFSDPYAARFPAFVAAVLAGSDPEAALPGICGKTTAEVERDLRAYIARPILPTVRFPAPALPARAVSERAVAGVEGELLGWELLVATGNDARSEEFLAQIARRYPGDAAVERALGDAAQRRKQDGKALAHYRRAIELGDRSGQLRYDLAMVRRALGAPDREVVPELREAVALEPRLFDAQFLLGYLLAKSGDRAGAEQPLRAAVRLRPWSAAARAELARVEAPAGEHAGRTKPISPAKPPDPEKVRGVLTQVDCLGERARLHLTAGTGRVFLLVRDPRNVFLRGASSEWTTLPCGEVPPVPVTVEYRAGRDASYGTAGDVVSVTFEAVAR